MDINKKFQILVNKLNAGQFDEVIFESTLLNKKFPKEEVFINLLSLYIKEKVIMINQLSCSIEK